MAGAADEEEGRRGATTEGRGAGEGVGVGGWRRQQRRKSRVSRWTELYRIWTQSKPLDQE